MQSVADSRAFHASPSPPSPTPAGAATSPLQALADRLATAPLIATDETIGELQRLAADPDRADAHLLAEIVSLDPLALAWTLSQACSARRIDLAGVPTTATAVLLMLGIEPFFRRIADARTVHAHLARDPGAQHAVAFHLRRAERSANLAVAIAAHRMDPDAQLVHAAAMLQHWGALNLWLHLPDTIAPWDPVCATRVSDPLVEERALGCTLDRLTLDWMARARIAPAILDCADGALATRSIASRTVAIAARLAVATEAGWDHELARSAIEPVADFLGLEPHAARDLLRAVD